MHTRILWSDTDDDGRVLAPTARNWRWYHSLWLIALIGFAAWAFTDMPW